MIRKNTFLSPYMKALGASLIDAEIYKFYESWCRLGENSDDLTAQFWNLWEEKRKVAFQRFAEDPTAFRDLYCLFEQLSAYTSGIHAKILDADKMSSGKDSYAPIL